LGRNLFFQIFFETLVACLPKLVIQKCLCFTVLPGQEFWVSGQLHTKPTQFAQVENASDFSICLDLNLFEYRA